MIWNLAWKLVPLMAFLKSKTMTNLALTLTFNELEFGLKAFPSDGIS